MALAEFNPETDVLDPTEVMPEYESDPTPEVREATLPDTEQDWTEVHPNGSREVLEILS